MHVVIDNTPLAFVPTANNSDIVTPDDLTFTHHTKTDHYIIEWNTLIILYTIIGKIIILWLISAFRQNEILL